jgi:hypothetical protein
MSKYEEFFIDDDDDDYAPDTKYIRGASLPSEKELEDFTLSFAYDYASVDASTLCFNNHSIIIDDYRYFFQFKKEVSTISVKQLLNNKHEYRFHTIDLYQKKTLIEPLKKLLGIKEEKIKVSSLPTIYQLGVYTDSDNQKAPRIVGFIGYYGIFHVLWFDYSHSIYPIKKDDSTTKKE